MSCIVTLGDHTKRANPIWIVLLCKLHHLEQEKGAINQLKIELALSEYRGAGFGGVPLRGFYLGYKRGTPLSWEIPN